MGEPKQSVPETKRTFCGPDAVAQKAREGVGGHEHAGDVAEVQRLVAVGHARRHDGAAGPLDRAALAALNVSAQRAARSSASFDVPASERVFDVRPSMYNSSKVADRNRSEDELADITV